MTSSGKKLRKYDGQSILLTWVKSFNVHYASELYKEQNTMNDAGMWKYVNSTLIPSINFH